MDNEKQRFFEQYGSAENAVIPDDGYFESLAVYRKIAEQMPLYDTVLFHGSALALDGQGYLFIAKSGTGKSTHARLWRERFGNRVIMINDDKPLVGIRDGEVFAFGTPWDGKHRLSTNMSAKLRAIFALGRAIKNFASELDGWQGYRHLLNRCYHPSSPELLDKTLGILDRISGKIPVIGLGCNMDPEAAQVAYDAVRYL